MWGYIGGYFGIMENKWKTTIMGSYRAMTIQSLGFRVWGGLIG